MKLLEKLSVYPEKLGKFKYPILVLLLGVLLLLMPKSTKEAPTKPTIQDGSPESTVLEVQEEQLAQLLSKMDGAGQVEVMLSVRTGVQTIYQMDSQTQSDTQEGSTSSRQDTSTVLHGTGSGVEIPVIRQKEAPIYQGAVILCEGAENSSVRLSLVQAVASITGLRTDQITVVKMG